MNPNLSGDEMISMLKKSASKDKGEISAVGYTKLVQEQMRQGQTEDEGLEMI